VFEISIILELPRRRGIPAGMLKHILRIRQKYRKLWICLWRSRANERATTRRQANHVLLADSEGTCQFYCNCQMTEHSVLTYIHIYCVFTCFILKLCVQEELITCSIEVHDSTLAHLYDSNWHATYGNAIAVPDGSRDNRHLSPT
jgi:hypothetical protein